VGTKDTVLPLSLAQAYETEMKAKGVRCDLVTYEGPEHGFFNRPEFAGPTLQRMDPFLRELGYLDDPAPK
jgi:dienelactone hydrolase